MRIALVARSSDQAGAYAGADTAVEAARVSSLGQALVGLGHQVTIFARRDSAALPDSTIVSPGITVEHVTAGPPAPLGADRVAPHVPEFAHHLARLWRRNLPDLVHAHSWAAGLAALAGARDLGVPVAQTFGSMAVAEQRHGMLNDPSDTRARLEACIARRADVVLASSFSEHADLTRLGAPRAAVTVVPCGVDPRRFSPEGRTAKRGARPRLLAAAPLTATRSLGLALCALAELPDAELVITGGPARAQLPHDQAYQALIKLAKALRVRDRLVFTGPVAARGLPALLRSADLLMSTTPYEPVGMLAIQAMACGTPVVTATAGAEPDAVVDMTTGLIAPPGRPAQVAWRIRRLLANPLRLDAYGIAAADRARSRYSWERIGRETLAAYAHGTRRPEAATGVQSSRPHRAGVRDVRHIPAGAPA